ncbi:hypothetical protein THAOC_24297, partial [Thalassiosira oceanica]
MTNYDSRGLVSLVSRCKCYGPIGTGGGMRHAESRDVGYDELKEEECERERRRRHAHALTYCGAVSPDSVHCCGRGSSSGFGRASRSVGQQKRKRTHKDPSREKILIFCENLFNYATQTRTSAAARRRLERAERNIKAAPHATRLEVQTCPTLLADKSGPFGPQPPKVLSRQVGKVVGGAGGADAGGAG